jgi:hypothetical protein
MLRGLSSYIEVEAHQSDERFRGNGEHGGFNCRERKTQPSPHERWALPNASILLWI